MMSAEIISVDTDITGKLLIIYSVFIKYLRNYENEVSNKSLLFSYKPDLV